MDLNIILWIGGTLFSLGIFAVKVGCGLSFGRVRLRGIFLILFMYLVLFILIAMLSQHLIKILEPVLRKGPYLHSMMAAGMIAWGIILLKEQNTHTPSSHHSILLLIPCPVCLTAMTFSTWSALNVVKFHPALVGMGLGCVFVLLSLTVYLSLKLISLHSSLIIQRSSLGLGMIAIGLYFIASLFLPAKIEQAKGMYQSFLTDGNKADINNTIGVLALLLAALVVGYFVNKRQKVKE